MSRVIFLVFFTLSVSSHASRDDKKGDMHVAVGSRSLAELHEKAQSQPEEDRAKMESALVQDTEDASAHEAERQLAMREFAEAAEEFKTIQAQSIELREAMKNLGFHSGESSLDSDAEELRAGNEEFRLAQEAEQDSAAKQAVDSSLEELRAGNEELRLAQETEKASAKQAVEASLAQEAKAAAKARAIAKLEGLAQHRQHLAHTADILDARLKEHEAVLQENAKLNHQQQQAVGVVAQHEVKSAEGEQLSPEMQFETLATQSTNLMQWLKDLKQLKATRDQLLVHRDEAEKAALDIGLTAEQVKEASKPKVDAYAKQKQQLADVMANSAVEMAKIESAAGNVMKGLDDFSAWKSREDHSPASLAEAEKVQENLNHALKFLEDHEGIINERTNQINALMKEANMGHL